MEPRMEDAGAPPTAARLLAEGTAVLCAAGIDGARLDAEVLLAAACATSRTAVQVRARAPVPPASADRFRALLARRTAREPVAYIVGRQEFWSLEMEVTPAVLIPRPETERLVEAALGRFAAGDDGTLCDLGTGSGCLAVALAHEWPRLRVWATDVSAAALAVAAANARRHGVIDRIRFLQGDLFAPVGARRFAAIVCNPPYVASEAVAALQPEVCHEPQLALDGGCGGLEVIGRVLEAAPAHLLAGGALIMEIGADQAAAVTALARTTGAFRAIDVQPDYAGLPRVLLARC